MAIPVKRAADDGGEPQIPYELLPLALDAISDYLFLTLAPDGVITSWNVGAERLLGWRREQAVGVHVSVLLGRGQTGSGIAMADLEAADRRVVAGASRLLTHCDGSARHLRTTIVAASSNSSVRGYLVVAHQVVGAPRLVDAAVECHELPTGSQAVRSRELSESRTLLAAEVAARTQAELSSARLLRRLVLTEENERRRLARDLHDGLGQRLTELRLILEGLRGAVEPASAPRKGIAGALELLAGIDQEVDFIAWELRPAVLDELGLPKVLDTYVREWSRQTGVVAMFHARPAILERFTLDIETAVYRIAQEALNNVAKHARAHSVNVLLELRRDTLVLVVEDDGAGFQPASAGETRIGLAGMRERAAAVGGTLEIEPTPGGGATILATIPTVPVFRDRSPSPDEPAMPGPVYPTTADRPDTPDQHSDAVKAIRTRLQELQRAVGARDEFIATVAHELRNPIAPLAFQVRLALNKIEQNVAAGGPISIEWMQTQLRGVERRLHRLLETLDRLLDVSRLSTGRIDLQSEAMNLAAVVREVVEAFEAELAVARCHVTLSERGDATGAWDRLRVEQICRNLLSNAIRFGAGRPIEIAIDADRDFASVSIRDYGIGIPADQQSRIFERFERGVEQRSGGFGIGLWIVRNLCVAMGGTVSVESAFGDGACFTVLLPRHPVRRVADSEAE